MKKKEMRAKKRRYEYDSVQEQGKRERESKRKLESKKRTESECQRRDTRARKRGRGA